MLTIIFSKLASLLSTPTVSLQWGKTPPTSVVDMTRKNLMVMCQ